MEKRKDSTRIKGLFLLVFALFFIFGCATTANYQKILQSWVGSHADNLVASWGPPQSSYQLSNGGWVLEYYNQRTLQMGGYTYTEPQTTYHSGTASAYSPYGGSAYGSYSGTSTTYVQKQTPVYNIPLSCRTTFTTDSRGIITNWGWQGNNCVALPPK